MYVVSHKALKIGQTVQCVYPSTTGADESRIGRVEKILEHGIIIELANGRGFRTLNVNKIQGPINVVEE